jgi:hypothetical protein
VCAKTGVPTDGYTKIRVSSAPTWTWILLLFRILPFLIAQYFATVHVEGIVPMSDVAQRRVTVFNRLFIGLVALGAVVIVVGWALDTEAAVILVGLAMMIAAVFAMFLALPFVLPSGAIMGAWVQLSFLNERFVAELDRFYGRSAAPPTGWNNSPTVKRWVLFIGGALILTLLMGICIGGNDTPSDSAEGKPDDACTVDRLGDVIAVLLLAVGILVINRMLTTTSITDPPALVAALS